MSWWFCGSHWTAAQEISSSNNAFNCNWFFVIECKNFCQKHLRKTQTERKLSEFIEFSESDKIKGAWIRFNSKISACYLWLRSWEVRSFVTQEFTQSNSIDCWCFCRWISFRESSSDWFTQVAISENSTAPLMFTLLVSQFALNLLYDSTQNIAPTSTHLTNLYLAVVVIDSNDTGSANSTTRN